METQTTSREQLTEIHRDAERFFTRLVRIAAALCTVMALAMFAVGVASRSMWGITMGGLAFLACLTSLVLVLLGNARRGRQVFVYGLLGATFATMMVGSPNDHALVYFPAAMAFTTMAGVLLSRTHALVVSGACGLMSIGLAARFFLLNGWDPVAAPTYVGAVLIVFLEVVMVLLFTRQASSNQRRLQAHAEDLDSVLARAQRIAEGDLSAESAGDGLMSGMLHTMLDGLRVLVTRTRAAAGALSSSAQDMAAMAKQQEQGSVEQASAVSQVHRTLASLVEGSNLAAQRTEDVFQSVEQTQRTTEVVAQRAAALSAHTRRISALLESIKSIANKSEILALNAALEGARAGEAGRGFSLVASQMQRLAESVMDSVRDVRALVEDIDAATTAALVATEESTRLSAQATAAARQIGVTLQQQRGGTEQVATAMQDIHHVATQVLAGSTQSLSATRNLTRLADELTGAIERFRL